MLNSLLKSWYIVLILYYIYQYYLHNFVFHTYENDAYLIPREITPEIRQVYDMLEEHKRQFKRETSKILKLSDEDKKKIF